MLLLSIPFDFSNDAPRIKVLRIKKARWCLENTSALLLADGLSLHYQSLLFTEKSRTCVFFLSFAKWKLYYSYQPLFHLGNNWVQLPNCEVVPARYLLYYSYQPLFHLGYTTESSSHTARLCRLDIYSFIGSTSLLMLKKHYFNVGATTSPHFSFMKKMKLGTIKLHQRYETWCHYY